MYCFVKHPRLPALVASVAAGLVVTAAGAAVPDAASARSADGACAASTQSLHGQIRGSDGRYVDATLGFDLTDAGGHPLDANGCVTTNPAPAFMINPNYMVPSDGSTTVGTFDWQLDGIPGNAVKVEIETYPRGPASAPRYQRTDTTHYARSLRRFALPTSIDVQVVLPRADSCPAADGVANRLVRAFVVHWNKKTHKATFSRDPLTLADAFSALPDRNDPGIGSPVPGLGIGSANADGTMSLMQLASAPGKGQPYTLVVRARHYGGRAYSTDYRGRQTFGVTACTNATVSVYETPGNLSRSDRHRLADYLDKHVKGFAVTNNR